MKKLLNGLFQKNKKSVTLIVLAMVTLLLVVIGATYAYFTAQTGAGSGTSINATTATTDSLTFDAGKNISLHVTMDDFLEGMESPHDETTAIAILKANNTTNQATARYNVFFVIDTNDFEYSTADGQAELLLKVTDPNGNEVSNIQGLTKVDGGFDVTTRTGGFLIAADYDIAATPTETTKTDTWKIEVTFVNLDANQNINKGKTFNGKVIITKDQESTYELAEINTIETKTTSNSVTASLMSLSGTTAIDKYYYAIEEDASGHAYLSAGMSVARLSNSIAIKDSDYIESDQPAHTFNNLRENTRYKVYSYITDLNGVKSNLYVASVMTSEYDLPAITGINQSSTPNSITIVARAKSGSNAISKYYFSKDNGATYVESTEPSYTFTNLLESTEYKIKIKAEDTTGYFSPEYYKSITTSTSGGPSITMVEATKTYNSISLTTTATGPNAIEKYYYKIGNSTWSEGQLSNTYTVSALKENTVYLIHVKVMDSKGKYSSEYALSVSTDSYIVPKIKNVTIDKTSNSITINTTAEKGTGTIAKYMYSKDGGSNWITQNSTSTTNSYTFENLTTGAEYVINVKVVDNSDRESSEYTSTERTIIYNFSGAVNDYNDEYNGSSHSLAVNLTGPSSYQMYYSTSTVLSKNNYESGSTTAPSRTEPGQTIVYWCAVATNYETLCGRNNITISKATPVLTLSTNSVGYYDEKTITYTYNGDGKVSCIEGTYINCSVNETNKTITFTLKGTQNAENITIKASEGTHYLPIEKIVYVNWTCVDEDTLVDVWDRKKKRKLKKKIKDIKVGDIVYTYDYESETFVTRKVKDILINKTTEIYHLFVAGDELKITADHEVCVEGTGYIKTSLLKVGYKVLGADGKFFEIEKIEIESLSEEKDMYCLELEDGSSFLIGKNGLVCLSMFVSTLAVMTPKSVSATALATAIAYYN